MKYLNVFLYELKHFIRNPFKIIALVLFILASVYGLFNGAELFKTQSREIEKIKISLKNENESILNYFDTGEKGPKDKPWIDLTTPYWAIRNTTHYYFKEPSPAIVYNIGKAEQYGFYKAITISGSSFDSDMSKEIANPERIQFGNLDFSFVILYLLPLLLLVLLYDIKGAETEQGFLALIYVQTGSKNWWILTRISFYAVMLLFVLFGLMLFGALLTDVINESYTFSKIFYWMASYLLLWLFLYFIILKYGQTTITNTIQMLGFWVIFTFIIPASIQQWVSIEKPTNLMLDIIDTKRDKTDEIYAQSNKLINEQLFNLYPSIKETSTAKDSILIKNARRYSIRGLVNEAMTETIDKIEKNQREKNELVSKTYWFNPLGFYQSKFNQLSNTHFNDYKMYRENIQKRIKKKIEMMVLDIWNNEKVDREKYLDYYNLLSEI